LIAALYVETNGVYYGLPNVDPWDEARDARLYAGPWPVVAHPPCAKWSPLAYINRRRLPGYRVGDDDGCFEAALAAVRRFGGVLEHPASSAAWPYFGLPRPARPGWQGSLFGREWVTEVDQAAYGHRARKRTLLLFVGDDPLPLDWSSPPVTARVSSFTHRKPRSEAERVRPREASRTTPAFRDALLALAAPRRGAREPLGSPACESPSRSAGRV
jgi:hypothetical protein